MADEKKDQRKKYQLLAGSMIVDGEEKRRGDTVLLTEQAAKRLSEEFGAVAPEGTLERRAQAEREAAEARERAEADIRKAAAGANAAGDHDGDRSGEGSGPDDGDNGPSTAATPVAARQRAKS